MRFNHFGSTILGTIINGQGCTIAVRGTHRTTLRDLLCEFALLSLRLVGWRSLKRSPAMVPAMAMCPSNLGNCRQRGHRSVSVVVVDSGTVGVS